MAISFRDLLRDVPGARLVGPDASVAGIAYDSRQVRAGDVFVCITGERFDGHDFIRDALERGAVGIVGQRGLPEGVPGALVEDSRRALGLISARFFDYPASRMGLIGITGTNGKTTTSYLVKSILEAAGYKVGLVGTIQNMIGSEVLAATRTTPESLDLQRLLASMYDDGVEWVVMEVSSHGIELGRIVGCPFDLGVLTNITQDHLDFHGTFAKYLEAKTRFFTELGRESGPKKKRAPAAIINGDDEHGRRIGDTLSVDVVSYGIYAPATFMAEAVKIESQGLAFNLRYPGGKIAISSRLTGLFNVYNCLAALACGWQLGIPPGELKVGLEGVRGVPGRFETVDLGQDFAVIIDYAHTPDGLENVLQAARALTRGRIILVFGCGGDRDRSKRPIMGEIAARYGDFSIITSDNPRGEDPMAICRQVEEGVRRGSGEYLLEVDRRQAINLAIDMAQPGDVVLVAGKGHENYQIFKDRVIHFDDREEAARALRGRKRIGKA
ncbi:MAG: UDP-N-acetylmuramoyl-L-alanyl-D-glutamate--2,6-diaminopimelate ligase [Limnochordia bacterium]|jgi:UDP-N-acetylmuramoyl-L-alanyl-D-glutamate--2,6-diaminopimelate ligase|nr:UDP-N-acetylmuramoyl-L-alanyl-D-glutamate--2,6-diaminopimelate ligase [Bacillota bacterium]